MKVSIEIDESIVERVVKNIMENFPEASKGCALVCIKWGYDAWQFDFEDEETGKRYRLNKQQLLAAFPLIFTDKWPKGCTQPPAKTDWASWEEWLCRCDATDDDAFAQLACLGEVIYG